MLELKWISKYKGILKTKEAYFLFKLISYLLFSYLNEKARISQ